MNNIEKEESNKIFRRIDRCSIHPDFITMRCVCNHIDKKSFGNIVILNNGDVLCQKCYQRRTQLNKNNIVFICSQCLKEIINSFIKFIGEENISKYIKGLENLDHTKGHVDVEEVLSQIYGEEYDLGIGEGK